MDILEGSEILIVDDSAENCRLLSRVLKDDGLVPRPVTSGAQAIEAAKVAPPDLVLLDLRMPEMSGVEVCRRFKSDAALRSIPIIFLSGVQGTEDKVEAFRAGGLDYISKPFQAKEVLARIKTHLQLRLCQVELASHNMELERKVAQQVKAVTASQLATIFALAKLAEARDDDTGHHIERVQTFSKTLAEQMQVMEPKSAQLNETFIETLFQTASLHDIGKVGISDTILLKPGKLTKEEFEEMKRHSVLGAQTLSSVLSRHPDNMFLRMGAEVARSHHEKWDGSGYPDGLSGKDIPLSARIVALADFYDALTSERCYRPPMDHDKTSAMIREGSGAHFDPQVVAAFVEVSDDLRRIREQMM